MTHKKNLKVASERSKIKEHMLLPPNDGQWKHPEHLTEHELLQVIQRESLNQNWPEVKRLLLDFPEGKRKDLIKMLKCANEDPLIGKDFPDEIFR